MKLTTLLLIAILVAFLIVNHQVNGQDSSDPVPTGGGSDPAPVTTRPPRRRGSRERRNRRKERRERRRNRGGDRGGRPTTAPAATAAPAEPAAGSGS